MVFFDDGELIYREEFVIFGVVPVNQPKLFPFGFAVALILNVDTLSEVAVEGFVVVDQVETGDVLQVPLSLVASFERNMGINLRQGLSQAVFEQDITKALAFGFGSFGFKDFAVFVVIAEGIEQFEVVGFDLVFGGEFAHKTEEGVGFIW